jgi:Uma2 family endonuclease
MTMAIEFPTLAVNLSAVKFTPTQFAEICGTNRDLRLELTSTGELIVLAPTGWGSSKRNLKLIVQVGIWNDLNQLGEAFESSGGFVLPNGAQRSPDVAWVERSRIEALNPDPIQLSGEDILPGFTLDLTTIW